MSMDQFPGVVGAEHAIWTLPTTAPQLLPSQPSFVSSRAGLSSGRPEWCAVSPQLRSTSIRSLLQRPQRLGIQPSIAWRRTGASQCLVAKHGRQFLKRISLAFSRSKAETWLSIERSRTQRHTETTPEDCFVDHCAGFMSEYVRIGLFNAAFHNLEEILFCCVRNGRRERAIEGRLFVPVL